LFKNIKNSKLKIGNSSEANPVTGVFVLHHSTHIIVKE